MWLLAFLLNLTLLVYLANCKLNLNAYNFGKNGGSIIFNYDESDYPNTKLDSIELSFMTYTFNCTLIHISSAISTDHITIRLANGIPIASYNLGYKTHQIKFRRSVRVNDGNYHKLRFNRFGQNSTLQLDSNRTVNLHPKNRSNARPFTVFNAHSHIRLGGTDKKQFFNYLTNHVTRIEEDSDEDDELNQREAEELSDERSSERVRRKSRLNYVSNQIINSLSNHKPNHHVHNQFQEHFVGIMMNVFVNGYSILDMAAQDNPSVILSGDVQLLLTLPESSFHKSNHFNHKPFTPNKSKDLIELMQGDQPAYERTKSNKNKVVRVNNDKDSNKDKQNQNYEGDDLIFSGSGCFDDEDECANYADSGSGYDDLIITPVYVPIKPTPISQAKSNSNKNNKNKVNSNKQRTKCTTPVLDEQANRPQRTEDDDNDEDDEEDDEDCGSGYEAANSNSEETTERSSNSVDNQINNNDVYQYSTEQSNIINPVTIEEDDKSILYTSQPIPPPASELEKIIESTTRRPPPPPKRPGGHIEIVMLPLPSESATPKTSFMNRALNKDNRKHHPSGIQITGGLSPNDINNLEDDLDASFDSNYNQGGIIGRESSLSDSGTSEILGGAIHINKNLIDFKFNKNSADRTALLIAGIAILIIIIVIIAPIVVFVKMRLRISRNGKLSGIPITSAQLSPAYQATSKSYASLAASGTMHPLGAPLNACNPTAFASNPNFRSSMHHLALGNVMPNLTLTTNPVYGTIDTKAPKLPNKKDLGKEWYV